MARGSPITWRNVAINDGSGSAALGNTAAGFGQNAVQGLSIFSDQMQDRIDREDTLLTNDAIASALSGGPSVSKNRRVDAEALQVAVERDRLGKREQEGHNDDLLTAAVNRRLNTANAGIKEKDLSTYDERFKLDKEIAASEAAYKKTQSEVALANLEELRKQRAQTQKKHDAFMAINQELYGPERVQAFEQEFEQYHAANAPADMSPADKAIAKQEFVEKRRQAIFSNPTQVQELAIKHGILPEDIYNETYFGQRVQGAQQAADAAIATRAALQDAAAQDVITNAGKFSSGDTSYVRFDGSDYVFDKDTASSPATFNSAFRDVGVDPESDEAVALRQKIESRFKSASVAEQIIKELVRDKEIPEGFSGLVDERYNDLQQRAINAAKQQPGVSGTGDPYADLQNFYNAIDSRTPTKEGVSAEEAGAVIKESPELAAEAIRRINDRPTSEAEVKQSQEALTLSVDGLRSAKADVRIPKDASNELKTLFNQFKYQVDVANGGLMLPEPTFAPGLMAPGVAPRPVKPRFADRRNAAATAADLLKELQALTLKEKQEAEAEAFRKQLD